MIEPQILYGVTCDRCGETLINSNDNSAWYDRSTAEEEASEEDWHWEDDIRQGFEECMRVLKPNGTLIFKWNEQQIPTARIIEIIGQKPLFGHTSGKGGKTIWMCFLKNEKSNETHL